ncbi:MAG: deoxyhypusine synthase family protein [Promethearchaeota archaeon]
MERKRNVEQVRVKPNTDVLSLIASLRNTGFNAKRLALACEVFEEMVRDDACTKFFALAGAMVPAGMQNVVIDMIRCGFIDVLVTTGANLTHDLAEALGHHHLQGHTATSVELDADLHEQEMNRIYDIFMPNEVYGSMEDFVKTLEFEPDTSVSEFLRYLGEKEAGLGTCEDSILKAAWECNVPVYCPAFTDSGLGMQVMFNFKGANLNHFKDVDEIVNRAWDANPAGVVIVGGGVPKNFVFQALQFSPTNAKYAVQLTMDRPEPGGLSGAELREAISWGKVNENAKYVDCICDATIALPIILAYLRGVFGR